MRLVGTSGIRGVAYQDVTPQLCQAVGIMVPVGPMVYIATDTRTSGQALEGALRANNSEG